MAFDWNNHYKSGGASGAQLDYTKSRSWKMGIIRKYCDLDNEKFLDVGCGDLQFWDGNLPAHYTGMDISYEIIRKNQIAYPHGTFWCASAATPFMKPVDNILCFDMLWHIIDDDDYVKILNNIKNNAGKTILIFTWSNNPMKADILTFIISGLCNIKKGGYQKYRDFMKIAMPIFKDFDLVEIVQNPVWSFGSMYVFHRR